ncbi:MAG: phasin family protein [Pseudomonadota bacterium]|nr:phasin family protein [Pseudomonadota bacterium]
MRKAALLGAGAVLAATEKLEGLSAGVKAAWKGGKPGTIRPEKIMTEASAAWLYAYWPDEIEETLEKAVAEVLRRLDIPDRKELEEIRARISALEARKEENAKI